MAWVKSAMARSRLTYGIVGAAAQVEGGGVVWLEMNGLVEIEDGEVELAAGGVGGGAIAEGTGVVGLESDGMGEVGDGLVVLAFDVVCDAAVVEGDGEVFVVLSGGLDEQGAGLNAEVGILGFAAGPLVGLGLGGGDSGEDEERAAEGCGGKRAAAWREVGLESWSAGHALLRRMPDRQGITVAAE